MDPSRSSSSSGSSGESSRDSTGEPGEQPDALAPASKRSAARARRVGQRLSFMNLLAYALVALALLSVFAHRR